MIDFNPSRPNSEQPNLSGITGIVRRLVLDGALSEENARKALAEAPKTKLPVHVFLAEKKLISAASQFYGVRADVAKIKAQSDQYNVSTALDAATKNQAADMQMIEDRLKALLTECQAFAQMATAMFNNLHASSGTGYNVSVS